MGWMYLLQDLGAHVISWNINPAHEHGITTFWQVFFGK
jgi:hypothetical protein